MQKNLSEENVDKENTQEEKFERGKYRNRERKKENLNKPKEKNWTIWSFFVVHVILCSIEKKRRVLVTHNEILFSSFYFQLIMIIPR